MRSNAGLLRTIAREAISNAREAERLKAQYEHWEAVAPAAHESFKAKWWRNRARRVLALIQIIEAGEKALAKRRKVGA